MLCLQPLIEFLLLALIRGWQSDSVVVGLATFGGMILLCYFSLGRKFLPWLNSALWSLLGAQYLWNYLARIADAQTNLHLWPCIAAGGIFFLILISRPKPCYTRKEKEEFQQWHAEQAADDWYSGATDQEEVYRRLYEELRQQVPPASEQAVKPSDPYTILEVSSKASREEIKAAYKKMVAQYHPDKVAHLGKDLHALAHEKTLQIQKAKDALGI